MPHFAPRYAELQLRDTHEENPESILDEHVQRVLKTPGCQSPGPGRHSPKPRSPDGGVAGKLLHGLAGTVPLGHARHATKAGVKPDAASLLHHHKHLYHHGPHHHGPPLKPKEALDGEASQRGQGGFAWTLDTHSYAAKGRPYGEGVSLATAPVESLGHR